MKPQNISESTAQSCCSKYSKPHPSLTAAMTAVYRIFILSTGSQMFLLRLLHSCDRFVVLVNIVSSSQIIFLFCWIAALSLSLITALRPSYRLLSILRGILVIFIVLRLIRLTRYIILRRHGLMNFSGNCRWNSTQRSLILLVTHAFSVDSEQM